MATPTIVIVHGAWHVPQHFSLLSDMFRDEGIDVHVPRLPSPGDLTAQSTLADDVGPVRELLIRLAEQGKTIIVIGHSYGGVVATEALRDMSLETRKDKGLRGGVIHIIYMCAYMLQPGESILTTSRDPPRVFDPFEHSADGISTVTDPRNLFYGDIDDTTAEDYISLLVPQPVRPFSGTTSFAAWQYIPSTYLKCTEDAAIFPAWQDNFIRAAQSKAKIEVHTWKSSHSPFISMPGEVVNVVRDVIAKHDKTITAAL